MNYQNTLFCKLNYNPCKCGFINCGAEFTYEILLNLHVKLKHGEIKKVTWTFI